MLPEDRLLALSPINRRRWQNFKSNRRGYWSLWIFLFLFIVSLFAEFIANDKPFMIQYDGRFYFPVDRHLSRNHVRRRIRDRGGLSRSVSAEADRGERRAYLVAARSAIPTRTHNLDLPTPAPSPPTWMLTEAAMQGRWSRRRASRAAAISNITGSAPTIRAATWLARLIYGFRISVLFGLILTIVSSVIGIAAGAVQGYFGGWTDLLFQRFIEIWTSVPSLYLLLIISSVLVPGFFVLLGILLLFSWVSLVGLVRAEFLRGRNFEYIQAARALGVSNAKIMFRHLLPNAMVATLTFLPFILSSSVMTLTALDFLGFGLPPGSPSLGELLSQGKANVQAPWLGLTGFFTIAIMLSLLIFIGEAVRDAFDRAKDLRMSATPLLQREGPLGRVPPGRQADAGGRPHLLRHQARARPSRWSANPAPANRSPPCRCSSCCPIRPRAIRPARSTSRARNCWRRPSARCARCAATTSPSSSRSR